MKTKSIIALVILSVVYACGSKKATVSEDALVAEINAYIAKVDGMDLKSEVTEGALTDAEGFRDVGTFRHTVFFDEGSKTLFKIENVEKTDATVIETYYFKNDRFVFVKFNKPVEGGDGLYQGSLNDGRTQSLKFYADKARRFRKAFEKRH